MKKSSARMRAWGAFLMLSLCSQSVFAADVPSAVSASGTIGGATCPTRSVDDLALCIQKHRRAEIDYTGIFASGAQVLVMAEGHHLAAAHRNELIGSINQLKRAGVTHLVMEAMPDSKQFLIQQFRAGTLNRDQLAQEIKNWFGWEGKSYAQLIDAALKNGIDVIFMDSLGERVDLSAPNWRQLELEARQRREAHWLNVIAGIYRSNQLSKLIVLVGAGHAENDGTTPPLQGQLSAAGLKNRVITLDGGDTFYCSAITEAARQAGLKNERFVVATSPEDSPTGSIYHIHLPEGRLVGSCSRP